MPRLRKPRPVSLTDDEYDNLRAIALEQGFDYSTLIRTTMLRLVVQPWLEQQAEREERDNQST
jgi:hypothetical protein